MMIISHKRFCKFLDIFPDRKKGILLFSSQSQSEKSVLFYVLGKTVRKVEGLISLSRENPPTAKHHLQQQNKTKHLKLNI